VTKTDPIMPLAQNYKDDVSLLESETALSKGTMNRMNTEFPTHQENDAQTNVSEYFFCVIGVFYPFLIAILH
jgi:hypothetical protein